MSVIVTDEGFAPDDWTGAIAPLPERAGEPGVDVPSDAAWCDVVALLPAEQSPCAEKTVGEAPAMVRITFPAFSDGRGFTLARRLRQAGYTGRLRAVGHVIADQYAMARRSGFDEVEIPRDLARRQPEEQWRARSRWQSHDYQSRLGRRSGLAAR